MQIISLPNDNVDCLVFIAQQQQQQLQRGRKGVKRKSFWVCSMWNRLGVGERRESKLKFRNVALTLVLDGLNCRLEQELKLVATAQLSHV